MRSDRASGPLRRVLAALVLLAAAAGPSLAQEHVFVTTPGDPPPGPTTCSLRQALSGAGGGCVRSHSNSPWHRVVEMAPWLANHHLVLEQGQLEVVTDAYPGQVGLLILQGHGLVIDAAGKSRAMKIIGNAAHLGSAFVMEDVTVTGGVATGFVPGMADENGAGGGILKIGNSDLILKRSRVHGNRANFGGGIAANGSSLVPYAGRFIHLYDSAIADNVAEGGTAPYVQGRGGGLNLSNTCLLSVRSTISGNHALTYGGGIYAEASASHCTFSNVYKPISLQLHQSTVSGNTTAAVHPEDYESGGAGILTFVPLMSYGSTITGNDGANLPAVIMYPGFGAATFVNTILSGNTVRGPHPEMTYPSPDLWFGSGSAAHSVIGTLSGLSGPGNVATDAPGLGPLADHGGFARTHLPSAASAVLGIGREAECSTLLYDHVVEYESFYQLTDQRRVARPGQQCDAGAVQRRRGAFVITAQVTGSGRVDATPIPGGVGSSGGISNCTAAGGTSCGATFVDENDASTLRFVATPAAGWQLEGWSGDCSPEVDGHASLIVDQDRTCAATFETIPSLFGDGFE